MERLRDRRHTPDWRIKVTDMYEKGLAIRKAVLGAEYVEKSLAGADDFTRPMQQLVTQYCWGEIWGNTTLSRRDRSLINIAVLSLLNRPHELKLHVKGALTNGATRDEIREVLLQVAIYGGVPAGIDATRIAREALGEVDAAKA
jgi:4-carboxymuconolactone decarboxylase